MTGALVKLEEKEGIAYLRLDRPEKRNALSKELRDAIVAGLDGLERDDAVGVVVLTGAGPAFCAGFDRDELASGDPMAVFAAANLYHRRVYRFGKPIVAAVNGAAVGGGCDLAAMCDVRLAAETATFGQPQVRLGIPAAYELMRSVIGAGAAREMCLTGRLYSAREALAIGLVQRVVPLTKLGEAAAELAREIASLPRGAAAAIKRGFVASQPRLFED
jgi:enoyl-CoA hydratase